ncbi:DUF6463 family protein [Stackebrandtia albiflava]|nr:DUF6463 family protein [Stackebrandtia albiflava]
MTTNSPRALPALSGAARTLTYWAGGFMLFIAAAHTAVFAPHPYWEHWISGGLRQAGVDPESLATFWALPGGFVVTLALLGLMVLRDARAGAAVPGYFGPVIAVWCLACTWLIGPSGFLSGLVPAALLIVAALLRRRRG